MTDNVLGSGVGMSASGRCACWWANLTSASTTETRVAGYDASGPKLKNISLPASAKVGQTVQGSAEAHDNFSPTAVLTWDFGDGTTATGDTVTHTFAQAGVYTVKMTAEDNRGLKQTENEQIGLHLCRGRSWF